MKLDVSNSVVIKDNYLTFNDKILTIQRYLYGGGYINDGWKYSQVKTISLGIDVKAIHIMKVLRMKKNSSIEYLKENEKNESEMKEYLETIKNYE